MLVWWNGVPLSLALMLLALGPVLGLLAVPSFADVLAADPRPPVVFMRAFEREGRAFVFDST